MRSVKYLVAAEPVDHPGYPGRIPDLILPSQFFESVGAQTFSSEQRLMLAILADAINVLGNADSSKHRKRNSFNEAWSWVFSRRITSALSFDHVCNALGMDADSLRRRLSELVSEHGGTSPRRALPHSAKIGLRPRPTRQSVRRFGRPARPKSLVVNGMWGPNVQPNPTSRFVSLIAVED
jgi:hypothetical protein